LRVALREGLNEKIEILYTDQCRPNYEIIVGCGRAGNTFFCLFGTLFENITLEKKKSIGATLIGSVTHDIRSSLPAEKLRFPF
jgi:hypothetical protein